MLGSPRPADHLDSTHTCLNNPENCQKTSRMDSLKASADERPTEEGRKGGEAVRATRTGDWHEGAGAEGQPTSKAEPPPPPVWLAKAEALDRVCSDNKLDLTSGRL